MRIDSFQPSQNTGETEQVTRRQQEKTPYTAETGTNAALAAQAHSLAQRLLNTPEVRQDRVDTVKQAVESGTHNVSNSQLADALFKNLFGQS